MSSREMENDGETAAVWKGTREGAHLGDSLGDGLYHGTNKARCGGCILQGLEEFLQHLLGSICCLVYDSVCLGGLQSPAVTGMSGSQESQGTGFY